MTGVNRKEVTYQASRVVEKTSFLVIGDPTKALKLILCDLSNLNIMKSQVASKLVPNWICGREKKAEKSFETEKSRYDVSFANYIYTYKEGGGERARERKLALL